MTKPFSGARDRANYTETALTSALEILSVTQVQSAMGPARAHLLSELIEQDFFAAVNAAPTYTLPHSVIQTDKIPVLAVRPEEDIVIQGLGMTLRQRDTACTEWAALLGNEDKADNHVLRVHATLMGSGRKSAPMQLNKMTGGLTRRDSISVHAVLPRLATFGRPAVLLNYYQGGQSWLPFTVIHEAGHVLNGIHKPVSAFAPDKSEKVLQEFSSYGDVANALDGLHRKGITFPTDVSFQNAVRVVRRVNTIKSAAGNHNRRLRITQRIIRDMSEYIDT